MKYQIFANVILLDNSSSFKMTLDLHVVFAQKNIVLYCVPGVIMGKSVRRG